MSIAAVTNSYPNRADGDEIDATVWNSVIDTLYNYLNGTVKPAIDDLQSAPANPLTQKGGMIGHNGSTSAEYFAGTDGQVLTRNSAATFGWEWDDLPESVLDTGTIVLWSGSLGAIPSGFALCDGQSGRPNLQGVFVVGAGNVAPAATSGLGLLNQSDVGGASAHTHGNGTLAATIASGAVSTGKNEAPYLGKQITLSGAVANADNVPRYIALAYIIKT